MEKQYVAVDLHRRRSLIVRQNKDGEELGAVRIDNSPAALGVAIADAGPQPEVAIEANYDGCESWSATGPRRCSFARA